MLSFESDVSDQRLEDVAAHFNLSIPELQTKIATADFTVAELYGLKKILNLRNETICALAGI